MVVKTLLFWGRCTDTDNRRARYYRLTREGRRQLQAEVRDWRQTTEKRLGDRVNPRWHPSVGGLAELCQRKSYFCGCHAALSPGFLLAGQCLEVYAKVLAHLFRDGGYPLHSPGHNRLWFMPRAQHSLAALCWVCAWSCTRRLVKWPGKIAEIQTFSGQLPAGPVAMHSLMYMPPNLATSPMHASKFTPARTTTSWGVVSEADSHLRDFLWWDCIRPGGD